VFLSLSLSLSLFRRSLSSEKAEVEARLQREMQVLSRLSETSLGIDTP